MKQEYIEPEVQVIQLSQEDVITNSPGEGEQSWPGGE